MSHRRRSLMPGAGQRLAQVAALAAKGLWFHRRLTLYQMIGLAAVLVPLLLIAGLKNGFIEGMLTQLRADPRNLEVIVIGNRTLDPAWFRTISAAPAAGFVIPNTRSLSATITLANATGGLIGDVQMIPTAAGDPLLGGLPVPIADDDVVLSAATARKLGVAAGDSVRAAVQRRMNGQDQASVRSLRVSAIAPETLATGDFAFVTLRLLVLSEDYRDGAAESIDAPGPDAAALQNRTYASARLYARDLDQVEALGEAVEKTGVSVRLRSQQIAVVRTLDHGLNWVAGIIVLLGMVGVACSIAVSQWLGVERRRREISVLRLIGLTRANALVMLVAEALAVAACAFLVAGIAFLALAPLADTLIAAVEIIDGPICRLAPGQFLLLFAITVLAGGLGALIGGARVLAIEPAECLREA
ncbi:FtsX-like permease family protein [Dongia sedimenti]|uniref:FtsX-like permease family protein n=1 Tax=Dongia sedimenti TaxID=3064282 RepID=A0ABU0YMK3_9PROT|nr:FtsX-like permease family protein [Rhodospirillaceae bacterium R-7]